MRNGDRACCVPGQVKAGEARALMPRWAARCCGLAIGVVCGLTANVRAEFRPFDDFQDEVVGLIDDQDGWTSTGGDNQVVLDPGCALNQVLYVPSASSILFKSLSGAELGVPNGTARMVFMRMRVANKQTFSVGLSHLVHPTEYSDFAPELGMANSAPSLDLRVWDDDGGNYEVLTQLTADTWYNVWIRVDAGLDQYEVWLNDVAGAGASAGDKLAASDGDSTFDFRAGTSSDLVTFYIKTSGGSSGFGPAYFDDIQVEVTDALNLSNPISALSGDCDADGTVELEDLAALDVCLLGPQVPASGCTCLDTDCDTDVDLRDFARIQAAFDP